MNKTIKRQKCQKYQLKKKELGSFSEEKDGIPTPSLNFDPRRGNAANEICQTKKEEKAIGRH